MARALYRTYRSKSFDEVVGQKHITDILKQAVKTGRISHAYLFTGPRGVGKTSVARILAHEINHLPYSDDTTHLDIIEIDAASNNGVEDVRDLRDKVNLAPSSADKKVYIIDEVHMLSKAAFNALLKTLEEPPEHVVFILATTDADKLPATIISRTQQFRFRAIGTDAVVAHLREIADAEKISVTDDALQLIAERGDGSFRDSISLLDQLSSLTTGKEGMNAELIEQTLGLAPASLVQSLLEATEKKDLAAVVKLLDDAWLGGVGPQILADQLIGAVRRDVASRPQLLSLLDNLLDVARSHQPQTKLLAVLGTAAATKAPKTVALLAPVREVSASIAELEREAEKEVPFAGASFATAPVVADSSEVSGVSAARVSAGANSPTETRREAMTESSEAEAAGKKDPKRAVVKNETQPFDWQSLIDYTRQNYVAIYSVLSKCRGEMKDGELTIYTGNAFYTKKLEDPKYAPLLGKSLQLATGYDLAVHLVSTTLPPKDEQTAAVAAIMGGGEEVQLEDGN